MKLFLGLTAIALAAAANRDGKCAKMTIRKEMNGKDCLLLNHRSY